MTGEQLLLILPIILVTATTVLTMLMVAAVFVQMLARMPK